MIETSSQIERDGEKSKKFGTPSKSRVTHCNEENQENIINLNETSFSTPVAKDSVPEIPTTVSARREWLNNFAKRNSGHFNAGNNKGAPESLLQKTQTNTKVNEAPKACTAVKSTIASKSVPLPLKKCFTPRMKKIVHSGIEATDDGYASVATLSQWLASDPTSKKKKLSVRRGRNVSYKSRKFDRGQERVIARENHIQRGSVSDKKNWLKNAFQNMDDEPVDELTSRLNTQYAKSEIGVYDPSSKRYAKSEIIKSRPSTMSVAAKKDWLKKAFKSANETAGNEEELREELRSMIITDDAPSRLSVSDKKSWLQSAFKKSEEIHSQSTRPSNLYSCATTDIIHSRGKSRDEIAARAKQRFLRRSTRAGATLKSPVKETVASERAYSTSEPNAEADTGDETIEKEELQKCKFEPTEKSGSIVEPTENQIRQAMLVEEDRKPVDFLLAREILVQRTRQSCHSVDAGNRFHF